MDAEFSVLGNAAKVKLSLTEFEAIAGHLLGVSKRAEVRQALKELVEEVRRTPTLLWTFSLRSLH